MADRQFTYKVNVDTASAQAAAKKVRGIFEKEMVVKQSAAESQQLVGIERVKQAANRTNRDRLVAEEKIRQAKARTIEVELVGIERIKRAQAAAANQEELLIQRRMRTAQMQQEGGRRGGVGNTWSQIDHILKTGFLAYGAAVSTKAIVQGTVEFGQVGAQQLRTMETFENLGQRIGVNAEDMAAAVKKASNSSISDMQAMQLSANVLAQRFAGNIDDIAGDTAILASASRRLAQIYTDENGELLSTEQVFSRLIKFAREGNKELVDQFGLSNELIAETLGIPNEGLRGAEGAANRWRGMIMVLQEELERLGQPADSLADRYEVAFAQMTTEIDKLRQAAAEPIVITVEFLTGGVSILSGQVGDAWNFWKMLGKEISNGSPSDILGNEINRIQETNNQGWLSRTFGVNPNQQRIDELAGIGQRLENLPFVGGKNQLGGASWKDLQQQNDILVGMSEMYIELTNENNKYVTQSKEGRDVLADWVFLMQDWESGQITSLPQIVRMYGELLTKMQEFEFLRSRTEGVIAEDFAPSALGALEIARKQQAAALQAKTLQDTALPSAQFIVASENIKKLLDAGVEGSDELKQRQSELAIVFQNAASAADPFTAQIWNMVAAMQAASLIGDVSEAMGVAFGPYAKGMVLGGVQNIMPAPNESTESWTETINKLFGEVTEIQISDAAEQHRTEQRLAEENAREWKQTAKEVERMFESAADKIMSIPGITSLTPVTEQEMLAAQYGVYQEQPDEWMRRVRDELLNNVDYANVSREQVAGLTGLSSDLPSEVLINRLEGMWTSGSLFADPANLGLMNMDAIRERYNDMLAGQQGRANQRNYIMSQLGISSADAALLTGQQAPIVQMLTGGMSEGEVGTQLQNSLTGPFGDAISKLDFAQPMISNWTGQLNSEDGQNGLKGLGKIAAAGFFAGFNEGIGSSGFATAIIVAIKTDIAKSLADMANAN